MVCACVYSHETGPGGMDRTGDRADRRVSITLQFLHEHMPVIGSVITTIDDNGNVILRPWVITVAFGLLTAAGGGYVSGQISLTEIRVTLNAATSQMQRIQDAYVQQNYQISALHEELSIVHDRQRTNEQRILTLESDDEKCKAAMRVR
jgi:hypothetical protein